MRDNKYLVSYCPIAGSTRRSGRFFPRSHEGLEAAIKLANREGVNVTLRGEVVWSAQPEMAPEPVVADGVDLGRLFDRVRAPRDWAGSEFADAVYGPKKP